MTSWDLSTDQSFEIYIKPEVVHVRKNKSRRTREYFEIKQTSIVMLSVH